MYDATATVHARHVCLTEHDIARWRLNISSRDAVYAPYPSAHTPPSISPPCSFDTSSAAHSAVAVCHHSMAFWSRRFFSLFQGFFTTRLSIRKVRPLKPKTRSKHKHQSASLTPRAAKRPPETRRSRRASPQRFHFCVHAIPRPATHRPRDLQPPRRVHRITVLIRYDVQLRCRCTAEASLLLSLWEQQLTTEDNAKAGEKKGIRGAVRYRPELWTAALGMRRQQLQQLQTHCSGFAQRLKRMRHGVQHEALAPNFIAFGLARCACGDLAGVLLSMTLARKVAI